MSKKRSPFPVQPDLFDFIAGIFSREKPETPNRTQKKALPPARHKQNTRRDNDDVSKTIDLNGRTIPYLLRRSRRRTIGFLIDESGLRVTAPKRSTLHSIENAIYEKRKWILDKLDFHRQRQMTKPVPVNWENGAILPYLGKERILHLENTVSPHAVFHLDENRLDIHTAFSGDQALLSEQLKKWLKAQALRVFSERLHFHAEKMNVRFDSFRLSNARTRWGSCSAKRAIRLNWRLIHCDLFLIDYVVIHELAHLLEMNHSQRFWAIVGNRFPDYRKAREQLRDLSSVLFALFPETD